MISLARAGGSSGGAAVALALRMLPVADGTDYGGSLRNPAGWNNVFGFRTSFGRVPADGRDAWLPSMGVGGPMARNVADLALLLSVQARLRCPRAVCRSRAAVRSSGDRWRPTSGASISHGSATMGDMCRTKEAFSMSARRSLKVFESIGCFV